MDEGSNDSQDLEAVKLGRLELALKASNEGIWDWWTDREEIYYSRRILEFLECGRNAAPHLFKEPFEYLHPDDKEVFRNAVSQALSCGGPETLAVDARVRTGSGDWRWLRIRATVVRDRSGKALRIAGSMINISRRKEAEAQVEDERFLLRQLIDRIPVQIYFKDIHSRIVTANKGMAEWVGLSEGSQLTGKHDKDFFDENHWKTAEADELRIMETGEPVTGQLEHELWNDGNETWVMTSKFPWRDRLGNLKGTFGISNDVTRIIKAQRQATTLAAELQVKNENYEQELQLAREIQQSFATSDFPLLRDGERKVDFGSRYIPISGLAGDFFDVIPLRDDLAAVMICDVMGHGLRSALVVAMLRGLMEKQRSHATDPSAFLHGLNEGLASILERTNTTMFATAVYGIIDLRNSVFSCACAGHPGPMIEGPDGVWQIAVNRHERGPGLGLCRGASYPTTAIPLEKIHRVVLFTDGVLEAENKLGEPFFEKRLAEIIAARKAGSLNQLLDEILGNVLGFSQSRHFDDDVCLLGFELSPS